MFYVLLRLKIWILKFIAPVIWYYINTYNSILKWSTLIDVGYYIYGRSVYKIY